MAILHRKEEKIQAVLGRLPKVYTDEDFVRMFIKLYSKDWGKIKSAYHKQAQDKEPGTVINMPKPELYLKQLAEIYLKANPPKNDVPVETAQKTTPKKAKITKTVATETKKVATTKKTAIVEATTKVAKTTKTVTKKAPTTKKTALTPENTAIKIKA